MNNEISESGSTLHNLKFIADASHVMQAEIARTEISLQKVIQWEMGSIVIFEKIVGSPIDLLIGDRLIAKGEVVLINDRYGVRINEITHPDEKPESNLN